MGCLSSKEASPPPQSEKGPDGKGDGAAAVEAKELSPEAAVKGSKGTGSGSGDGTGTATSSGATAGVSGGEQLAGSPAPVTLPSLQVRLESTQADLLYILALSSEVGAPLLPLKHFGPTVNDPRQFPHQPQEAERLQEELARSPAAERAAAAAEAARAQASHAQVRKIQPEPLFRPKPRHHLHP